MKITVVPPKSPNVRFSTLKAGDSFQHPDDRRYYTKLLGTTNNRNVVCLASSFLNYVGDDDLVIPVNAEVIITPVR